MKTKNLLRRSTSLQATDSGGSILIIALWTLCLLTFFAVYMGYGIRQKMSLAKRLDEKGKLRFIAEASVNHIRTQLKKEGEEFNYTLKSDLSSNIEALKDMSIGDGICSIRYDYIDAQSGLPEVRYGIVDEESKININKANRAVLRRLCQTALGFDRMEAQELAASIMDWRDSDSMLSLPIGSAEDSYYRNIRYSYESKDAEFEILEELLLVKGMTRDIFERMKYYVTIYGNGKVNVNTASRITFLALGLDDYIADKIISFRDGEDGVTGTDDDNIFGTPHEIVPKLSQFYRLSSSEIAKISAIVAQNLVADSDNFMIRSTAKLKNGNYTTELVCVVNKDGKILYWQEL